jgi:hypothetical protein
MKDKQGYQSKSTVSVFTYQYQILQLLNTATVYSVIQPKSLHRVKRI